MATNNNFNRPNAAGFNRKKTEIFFQDLNRRTTEESLRRCLQSYPIIDCYFPIDADQKNKGFASVTFRDEDTVRAVMKDRPHNIDGKDVFIHRKVPGRQPLRDSYRIEHLRILQVPNNCSAQDLQSHFRKYGTIQDIWPVNDQDNSWIIHYDDYDSVDQSILDQPHWLNHRKLLVEKAGPEYRQRDAEKSSDPTDEDIDHREDDDSNDECPPGKGYRIHVMNLPRNVSAKELALDFKWPISDIVMKPSLDDPSKGAECWLIDSEKKQSINQFIRRWNGQKLDRSTIECEREEFDLELCTRNRFGTCAQSATTCLWEHIDCKDVKNCSNYCPFGHPRGIRVFSALNERQSVSYRIKMTGFVLPISKIDLSRMLSRADCFCNVDQRDNRVGYLKLKTLKAAKAFVKQWHEKEIRQGKISCQIELEPTEEHWRSSSLTDIPEQFDEKEEKEKPSSHNKMRKKGTVSSIDAFDSPTMRKDDQLPTIRIHDEEEQRESRIFGGAVKTATATPLKPLLNTQKGGQLEPLPNNLSLQWDIIRNVTSTTEQIIFLCDKTPRRRPATIKIYKNNSQYKFHQESTVLHSLKGVTGVVQLMQSSTNQPEDRSDSQISWILMERAPGRSLQDFFMDTNNRESLSLLKSIQLTQKLIEIIGYVHEQQVFHQNLSPDHIIIDWDARTTSIRQAQLTLINFTQAKINIRQDDQSSELTRPPSSKWYNPPQNNHISLDATIDASNVCAVLLWLLTHIVPQHDNQTLPHYQPEVPEQIDDTIASAFVGRNEAAKLCQVKNNLIDTFNRAFGYPDYRPWTLLDLQVRLEMIHELISPSNPKDRSVSTIFDDLRSIPDTKSVVKNPALNDLRSRALDRAADAFCKAKRMFVETDPDHLDWSNKNCVWMDSSDGLMREFRYDDILTHYKTQRGVPMNYSMIITFIARLSDNDRMITLSIGGNVNGKNVQVPIILDSTARDFTTNVTTSFPIELKTLMIAMCERQKAK